MKPACFRTRWAHRVWTFTDLFFRASVPCERTEFPAIGSMLLTEPHIFVGLGMLGHLLDSVLAEMLLLLALPALAIRFLFKKLLSIRVLRLGMPTEPGPVVRDSSRKQAFARAIAAYEELIDVTAQGMDRRSGHRTGPRAIARVKQA